jgi:hypothetical protein
MARLVRIVNNEDEKIRNHLVDEMMKVSETNPDVMIYMQSLMKCYEDLEKEIARLNNITNKLDELIEQYSKNDYYYKYNGKYLKSEIISDLKALKGSD